MIQIDIKSVSCVRLKASVQYHISVLYELFQM